MKRTIWVFLGIYTSKLNFYFKQKNIFLYLFSFFPTKPGNCSPQCKHTLFLLSNKPGNCSPQYKHTLIIIEQIKIEYLFTQQKTSSPTNHGTRWLTIKTDFTQTQQKRENQNSVTFLDIWFPICTHLFFAAWEHPILKTAGSSSFCINKSNSQKSNKKLKNWKEKLRAINYNNLQFFFRNATLLWYSQEELNFRWSFFSIFSTLFSEHQCFSLNILQTSSNAQLIK